MAARTDLDLPAIEARLLEQRRELRSRLSGLAEAPERGADISFGKRIGDGTIEAVSRLTDIGVGRSLETSEGKVERALAKLADGTYGICDGCGRPIPARRLEAMPESVLCVECARRAPRG
jgi:DnaK suppressor protein